MTTREQILLAILDESAPLSERQQRGAIIAANMGVEFDGGRCLVASQSGRRKYSVDRGGCDCPDFRGTGRPCKHMAAVEIATRYAETLAARVMVDWDETTAGLLAMEQSYEQFLAECRSYRPPSPGLLTGFRLEAVGDDDWQKWRAHQRARERGAGTGLCTLVVPPKPPTPWVAMITGACPHYEFSREFLRGKKDYREADKYGSRGVWMFWELPPGLYESQELEWDRKLRGVLATRRFFRVADQQVTYIEKPEVMACLRGAATASSRPN